MIQYVDRQDGTFTPQMSDRINIKSSNLWEKIQELNVTPVYPKIECKTEPLNTSNNSLVSFSVDNSIVINSCLHIVNVTITFTTSLNADSWVKIGDVAVPPNTDLIMQYNDGQYLAKVEKGSTEIRVLGSLGRQCRFYFYYVV